jgi:hypothetical protein
MLNYGKDCKDLFSPISNETPFHAIPNLVHFNIQGHMQTFHLGMPNILFLSLMIIPDTPTFII